MLKTSHSKGTLRPLNRIARIIGASVIIIGLAACSGKTADEHIQQALVFVEQGDNAAAVVELKNAVQQEPTLALARLELGKVYLQTSNFESAEKELSRALELGHPAEQVLPHLSLAYQRTNANVALADLDISAVNLTVEERLEINYRKLQALLQLDKVEEAREIISQSSELASDSVYSGLIAAHLFVINGEFESALEKAVALQATDPLNRDVLGFTARLYMLNGQPEEAANIYEAYVKVASDDIESKFALANMLVEQGAMERAEVYVDELMQISDTNPLLNQLKGIIRAADNDYTNALAFSEKAIQSGRSDPRLRLVAGFSAYQLAEFEKAVGHLSFVASSLPDGHPGLRILAASQLQTDQGTDASEVLLRLDNASAGDASLFSRAGFELIQEGNVDAARAVIEQANKISETADDLTRLGILKLSLNDVEGLINLEQAVEQAPESVTARTTLASAYLGTQQNDKALELAKEWQANAPEEVEGYLLEVEVLQRQEKFDEALAMLNSLDSIAPNDTAVMTAKIRLYLRQTNTDEAIIVTEQLLTKEPANATALASFFAIKQSQGDIEAGLARVQQAFEDNGDSEAITLLLGRAALVANQPKLSLQGLSNIEADRSAPNQFWSLKGTALLRDNQVDEALAHYEQWASLYPLQEDAALGQLLILDGQRKYEDALNLSSDFLAKKDNLQMTFMQSYFYVMTGDVANAKNSLANIDAQYQPLPFLRGVKARIALLEQRPADAVDDALVAYEQNKNTNNLFVLTQALQGSDQLDRSKDILQAHLAERPDDMRAKMLLAENQISAAPDDAITSYREMLELNADNFVVLNNLAYLLMQNGELVEAADLAKRAYDIQPDNVPTVDTYAQVLVKQKKYEEAVEAYNTVMNDRVLNEEIILNYIDALLRNGSKTVAQRRLEARTFVQEDSLQRLEAMKQEFNL
jgi:putative PEP-CTERM system TPR-repeat lipoprotein